MTNLTERLCAFFLLENLKMLLKILDFNLSNFGVFFGLQISIIFIKKINSTNNEI
jgi:hypothetical protein